MSSTNTEIIDRVRALLQRDKIRLWEAPYTDPVTGIESIPEDLVESICAELGYSASEIRHALSQLRQHALEKLAAKQRADWIHLKIRFSGSNENKHSDSVVSVSPNSTGNDLRQSIEQKFNLHDQNLKIICSGRMIQSDKLLVSQNVQSNATILVITVPKEEIASATRHMQQSNLIEAIKEATQILDENARSSTNSTQYQLRLTDQHGRELTALSDDERRSLMVAMTLHEKGRSFLRQRDYLSALALFSEADNEFRQCSSQMLNSVDNWGLLNLDIVWCYLCMQNVNDLQDAGERLMKCDSCFVKVYGNSFQRLKALQKNGMGHMVLFVRLHLLQGIVAYHEGRKFDAKNFLKLAAEEAQKMHVDPEKLTQILLMGYTATEARRGLRSAEGDIDRAIEFIIENRRVQDEHRREEEMRKKEERIQRRYGYTQNGQKINMTYLEQLQSMGYPVRICAEALKQTNNRLEEATDILLNNPDILMAITEPATQQSDHIDTEEMDPVDRTALITQLVALGAEPEVAEALLTIHSNQLTRAAEEFLQKFSSPVTTTTDLHSNLAQELIDKAQAILEKKDTRKKQKTDEKREKLQTIVPELLRVNRPIDEEPQTDDDQPIDHLDVLLDEEESFIEQYRQRLMDDGYW